MTGAVLNTINIRLDAKTISYILEHGEAKVLVVDRQLHVEVKKALSTIKRKITIIDINDKYADCLLYTSPSPRDWTISRMPSSA